jgi:hypothetical protein
VTLQQVQHGEIEEQCGLILATKLLSKAIKKCHPLRLLKHFQTWVSQTFFEKKTIAETFIGHASHHFSTLHRKKLRIYKAVASLQ